MENLEISDGLIQKHIVSIESLFSTLKNEKDFVILNSKIKKFKTEIKSLQNELNMFEIEICSAMGSERDKYMNRFDNYTD